MNDTIIHVGPPEGPGSYDVVVGRGTTARIASSIPAGAARAFVVHAAAVRPMVDRVASQLRAAGIEVDLLQVPDGERAKTFEVLVQAWEQLGEAAYTRTDVVVGVGGGAVTDLAGFIAATWLRGVRVLQVPTTLLAMVDAAVGGKTGINTPQGKNLVGAFHPPAAVLCDLDVLRTLPEVDLTAGLAEVIKCGFIADPQILQLVEDNAPATIKDPMGGILRELVERAITVKARVVTGDLRESDLREILNYGHTFAHAIEQAEDFRWRHGDAVSVGMVFVAELARAAGCLPAQDADRIVERHRAVLTRVGLPVTYGGSTFEHLMKVMSRDKKARGATMRFVVLTGLEGSTSSMGRLGDPAAQHLQRAFEAVRTHLSEPT